jgi:hypothetical protein
LKLFWYTDPTTGATTARSLIGIWLDTVTSRLKEFFVMPYQTLNQDNLARAYIRREQRDQCGDFAARIQLDPTGAGVAQVAIPSSSCATGALVSFPLSSNPLSDPLYANTARECRRENYGPDTTAYANPTAPVVCRLGVAIPW